MDLIQKTRDDYNTIAQYFSETRRYNWSELEQFKSKLRDGQYILDWGCGNGRLLDFLKDTTAHYFGIDQSQGLLKQAKKRWAKEIKSGKAKFFCTAHKEKKFPNNYFDLVFMIASFHHLPDKKSRLKVLKKTYREMKPGAELIITVWNLGSDWAKEKMKRDWKKLAEHDYLIPWKSPAGKVLAERYYHHFQIDELTNLLAAVGFKVRPIEPYNTVVYKSEKGGRNLVVVAIK